MPWRQSYRTQLHALRRAGDIDIQQNCTCVVDDKKITITGTPVGGSSAKVEIPFKEIVFLNTKGGLTETRRYCYVAISTRSSDWTLFCYDEGVGWRGGEEANLEPGFKLQREIMERAGLRPGGEDNSAYRAWLQRQK